MKKLFFAICFNICFLGMSYARITPISGYTDIRQEIIGDKNEAVKEVNREEFSEFLSERMKIAKKVDKEDINKTTSFIESDLEKFRQKEQGKNFFQKTYEQAIKRINNASDEEREDVDYDEQAVTDEIFEQHIKEQKNSWEKSSIPMVTAVLPNSDTFVEVPAIEHIPYLMNNIEILPNGIVKFEETIMVVANNQKLKSGLTKILPSRIFNKKRKAQNIDYSIIGVSINGEPINYKLAKSRDRILLVPEKKYRLPAGIYTYKFEYLADNLLLDDNNSYNFYWDIGGNGLNLIVDRTLVKLTTPNKNAISKHDAIIGSIRGFYSNSVTYEESDLSYLYTGKVPLFIGTGMHLVADIDKNAFYPVTIAQKFIRAFYSYGDIYISIIGLLIIAMASIISWKYILKEKSRVNVALNKTSLTIRYILNEKFDKKSVCGFLLDLYKKNIIDIQQSGDTILLIKSTDNLKSLLAYERKALKCIFPSHETTFSVTKNNKLPLKRFINKIGKGLKRDVLKFKLKLNQGYLLLNIAMMSIICVGISAFKINPFYTFTIIALTSLLCFCGVGLWFVGSKKWQKFITRYISVNIMLLCWVLYSAVIHPFAALLLIFSIIFSSYFIKLYSGVNGLIRPYIQDIMKQKKYLLDNKDVISLSKDFIKYQPFIFVCDLENELKPSKDDEKYKIPVIENIMERI